MASPHIIPVNLFCDFDGVICPIPRRNQIVANDEEGDQSINPDDLYVFDRHGITNTVWSSQMAAQLRFLVIERLVRWHWLTSNQYITDYLDDMLGFDSNQTITEELFVNYGARTHVTPGGKAGIIRRAIRNSARSPHPRGIVWIDDDYSPTNPEVGELVELASEINLPFKLITPQSHDGLTRSQMHELYCFVLKQAERLISSPR